MNCDVTEFVEQYRLALRHIWNTHFWSDPKRRHWESVYSFRTLKQPLFNVLVADRLDLEHGDSIFGSAFHVVPAAGGGDELPFLQVNLRVPSSPSEGCWDFLQGPFPANEITLTLVDLFDWSPMGYLDLRYFVVFIQSFAKHPDKVGQHALVDVAHARVVFEARGGVAASSTE